jgi:hypothetical protein
LTRPGGSRQLVTRWFTDPFARQTDIGMLAAVNCGRTPPAPFDWSDAGWRTPELDDLIVYELQVEQFNDTFAGVADRLVYLKSLGVNCLELMPVTSTKLDSTGDTGRCITSRRTPRSAARTAYARWSIAAMPRASRSSSMSSISTSTAPLLITRFTPM